MEKARPSRGLYLEYLRPLLAALAAILIATSLSYIAVTRMATDTATSYRDTTPAPVAAVIPYGNGSLTLVTSAALYAPRPGPGEKATLEVTLEIKGPRLASCTYYIIDAEKAPSWLQAGHSPEPMLVPEGRAREALAAIEEAAEASAKCGETVRLENPPPGLLAVVAVYQLSPDTVVDPGLVNGTLARCVRTCRLADAIEGLLEIAEKDPTKATQLVKPLVAAVRPPPGLRLVYSLTTRPAAGSPAAAALAGLAGVALAALALGLPSGEPRRG